jgi:hypothetical protein
MVAISASLKVKSKTWKSESFKASSEGNSQWDFTDPRHISHYFFWIQIVL